MMGGIAKVYGFEHINPARLLPVFAFFVEQPYYGCVQGAGLFLLHRYIFCIFTFNRCRYTKRFRNQSIAIMNLCSRCRELLLSSQPPKFIEESKVEETVQNNSSCSICLGVFTKSFGEKLTEAIRVAAEPYGTKNDNNRFSRHVSPPNIILPADIAYRFQRIIDDAKEIGSFCQEAKQHAKNILNRCIDNMEKHSDPREGYPSTWVETEESGYLAVHVIVMPSVDTVRPEHFLRIMMKQKGSSKQERRRNIHENSQGGDPRMNLECRISDRAVWTLNQACEELGEWKSHGRKTMDNKDEDLTPGSIEIHVAIWRRPFYLRGMYSKTRRDVSQTPFFVVDDGKRRKLGVTSLEEQITPSIVKACGGISTLNNNPNHKHVVFGMAKFHASGREDMDVRMLLPELPESSESQITGRPFVYEIIDAYRVPSLETLQQIVREVNHFTNDDDEPDPRSYGRNPMGVGISKELMFVPSVAYKKLQEETESKVKHYGCLCWSENPLPATDEIISKQLGSFPLEIHQRTPIRVLHRRANAIRIRHVLSCRANRIDDHYFRLHLSTSAGTYVKEFVRGDLGRTVPNIGSLLGCSTDILELDCEGIQI
jgi:tRNA pseudouridine(54/55) synthase